LWVDATTHTILQFRTIDFGMEKCSLAIRIPYSDGELEGGARFSLSEGSKLDIYALDEPKSINVQKALLGFTSTSEGKSSHRRIEIRGRNHSIMVCLSVEQPAYVRDRVC